MYQAQINQIDAQGRKQGYWREGVPGGYIYKGHYYHGTLHGLWVVYYPDGTLWQRHHFHHGKLHGSWADYRSDGTLGSRGHYHHDLRHGVWEYYRPDGTLIGREHYFEDMLISQASEETLGIYNGFIRKNGVSTWGDLTDHIELLPVPEVLSWV